MASEKPRILQNNRDMVWSLVPLVLFCVIIAGIASQCTFSPGGPTSGPIPSFDVDAALTYDARELGFPIRHPDVPEGWTPNSGSRAFVGGGDSSTVGFITPPGRYVQLTQSDADETPLVTFIAGEPRTATGSEDIGGRTWVLYGGEGVEPIWTSDFTQTRIAVTGSGSDEEFRELAAAVGAAEPLDS
ncbi:DUF4245 domain-containing protein [Rhodococcus sp. NPDC058521]|uniref:DUF4245 domain-containing protein n=1 Tax=Rhodococcus sp. NPDC058521 TaxID=3346536 RepID=UPI003646516E